MAVFVRCSLSSAVLLLAGCGVVTREAPVQVVRVTRDNAPALAVFHQPDIRINALAAPALEMRDGAVVRFDRGGWTADSAYFAEPPWTPAEQLTGSGVLRVSFCRSTETFCSVDSFPVRLD
jgi:hypothetical protein